MILVMLFGLGACINAVYFSDDGGDYCAELEAESEKAWNSEPDEEWAKKGAKWAEECTGLLD